MTTTTNRTARTRPPRVALVALVGVLIAVAVGGAYGLWYMFLRPAGPAAVTESSVALPTVAAGSTAPLGSDGIAGNWKVDTSIGSFSDFSDSFVGYRVQEELASIGAQTAVGRTPSVSGTMTIEGTTVTAVSVEADLTALKSDDDRRDGQLQRQGLETSTYPTATFTLTSPIELGSVPADGQEISVTASGQLTLHGVTKDVQVPLKARLSGNVIVISGSLPITFADYGMTKPSSFAVLSVADQGTMELQLFFTKA